jgi:hypothetical protein
MRILPLLCLGLALAGTGRAAEPAPAPLVDANIVTAIDGSDSVGGAAMRLQLDGLAAALRAPSVIAAIRSGRSGRIGFAVFVWHTVWVPVVPWTVIATAEDADAVARAVEARTDVSLYEEALRSTTYFIGRLTDLSLALDHAGDLLAAAPFRADRAVLNVLGNGADNTGEPAAPARDRLLAAGTTINAVAFGDDPELIDYFRREVTGGPGAFVLPAAPGRPLADLMRRKLLRDLIALGAPLSAT